MNAQTVVGKEVVNVSKDLGNLIGGVIQSLAEKLSVPVSQVYDVLRTQMIIEGWSFMIITVTIILILATVMKVSSEYEFLVDDKRGSNDPTRWFFIFTFSLIGCFTSICIFIYYFTESLSKILNPDYYVLQTITEMTKGIIGK
jgi:hypothetical protein